MKQEKKTPSEDTMDLAGIRDMLNQQSEFQQEDAPCVPENQPEEAASKSQTEQSGGVLYEMYGLLHDVVYILTAVTIIFVFFIRMVGVDGDSMFPTLRDHDYLLLESNCLYRSKNIEQGDIVVLTVPYLKEPIVKRVIATAGQEVDVRSEEGLVYVDGVAMDDSYTNTATYDLYSGSLALKYPTVVPEGCVYVLGDNRGNSMDSRYAPIGMIDERCVLGKVFAIVIPGATRDMYGNLIEKQDWHRIGFVS